MVSTASAQVGRARWPTRVLLTALAGTVLLAAAFLAFSIGPAGTPEHASAASTASALPGPAPGFKVQASSGYTMYVVTWPSLQRVELIFLKEMRGRVTESEGAIYGVQTKTPRHGIRAEVHGHTIRADLGHLGMLDVHFVPTGGSQVYRPYCGGEAVRFPRGYYEGTIDFTGEHHYTRAFSARGVEDPRFELRAKCRGREVVVGPQSLPGAELVANSLRASVPAFRAFKSAPAARAYFVAAVNESSYGLAISRFVGRSAPPAAFEYSSALDEAVAQPPAPFSGTGTYDAPMQRDRRWTGSLSVKFPGRGSVSLTHSPIRGFINPARWSQPGPIASGRE